MELDHDSSDNYVKACFRDRREAGRVLAAAERLPRQARRRGRLVSAGRDPRGLGWGVPAARGALLDACVVRKLGATGHDEFAVGAMALGGRVVVNGDVLRALRVTPEQLREVAEREG